MGARIKRFFRARDGTVISPEVASLDLRLFPWENGYAVSKNWFIGEVVEAITPFEIENASVK